MRILHVIASYLPAVRYGGTIVSVHGLCRALAQLGHDVHVFTTSVDGDADSPVTHDAPVDMDGVKVWYFRSQHARRLYYAPAMASAADAHIREFDVVHSHAMFLWPGWAVTRRARSAGVPYVIAPRGMLEKGLIEQKSTLAKSILIGLFERRTLEAASAIHVTSSREAEELARFGFSLPPIYEIPNGVDELQDDRSSELDPSMVEWLEQGPFAMCLGRISWKKGLDRLIAALPFAPQVRVLIAGNDDESLTPSLRAIADRLQVADRVRFSGPVYGALKSKLLSSATFLAVPSYSENFGNVVLEALAHSCPVVMTPEVGVASTIARSGAGVVAEGTPEVFGHAMADMQANVDRRARMGACGRQLVAREFSWSAVAERTQRMYRDVLRSSAA